MTAATVVSERAAGGTGRSADQRVAAVQEFGRFWARDVVSRLDGGLTGSPYCPAEARVIFDLGSAGPAPLGRLGRTTGVDDGQLSRIVHRLRDEGVVAAIPSPEGGGPLVELTVHGQEVLAMLDRQIAAHARSILAGLREDRQRDVVAAMATIRRALSGEQEEPFTLRSLRPGDLGWVVQRHGCVYADEYGWDERFEGEVAGLLAGFATGRDPARERGWIAEVDAAPAGCVFCLKDVVDGVTGSWTAGDAVDPRARGDDARMSLLLVDPQARGLGLGRRLVGECVAFARLAGYRRLLLRTEDVFTSSRRIVEAAGFELLYEGPHRRYGHTLHVQHWALSLTGRPINRLTG